MHVILRAFMHKAWFNEDWPWCWALSHTLAHPWQEVIASRGFWVKVYNLDLVRTMKSESWMNVVGMWSSMVNVSIAEFV